MIVHGNPMRLRQAVDNLLGNAIKMSPPAATVSITAYTTDLDTRIEVRDQGPAFRRLFSQSRSNGSPVPTKPAPAASVPAVSGEADWAWPSPKPSWANTAGWRSPRTTQNRPERGCC